MHVQKSCRNDTGIGTCNNRLCEKSHTVHRSFNESNSQDKVDGFEPRRWEGGQRTHREGIAHGSMFPKTCYLLCVRHAT